MGSLDRSSEGVVAYEGGSFRDRAAGKGLYKVIPPEALRRLARRYEYGAVKYGKSEAFKDGLPVSDCWDSAIRHLVDYMDGDNSEDHLAAVMWNCAAMMYMEMHKPDWQDIPARRKLRINKDSYMEYTKGVFK